VELTTPACPLKAQIEEACIRQVLQLPGVTDVQVRLSAQVRGSDPWQGRAPLRGVRTILAVASGKGGVGKSTISTHLAIALASEGCRVGLLDADIYGPSIPMLMGISPLEKPRVEGTRLVPLQKHNVRVMSLGLIVEDDIPLLWSGPLLMKSVARLLHEVVWGILDYLVVDLPPGTGDVSLSLVQKVPVDGVLFVTTPQRLALLDVMRGIRMFQKVRVPILGIVENMSTFCCPHCQETTPVFKIGGGRALSEAFHIPYLGNIPIDPAITLSGDQGEALLFSQPHSPLAHTFQILAQTVAANLSVAKHAHTQTKGQLVQLGGFST
jgi:ATP-binding protein involved in chromosome partitioning